MDSTLGSDELCEADIEFRPAAGRPVSGEQWWWRGPDVVVCAKFKVAPGAMVA